MTRFPAAVLSLRFPPRTLLAVAAASCLSLGNAWAGPVNPLATADQQALDAAAISVFRQVQASPAFLALKVADAAAYSLGTLGGLAGSAQNAAALSTTINELAFSAVQKAINSDPARPKVYWDSDAAAKQWWGLNVPAGRYSYDNPDAIYRLIPVSSQYAYAVKGHRSGNGPTDQTFSLISDPNAQTTIGYLSKNNIVTDADGNYTITIDSAAPASGQANHIQSTSAAKFLLIRDNLGNWNTETPDALTVQRTDAQATPAPLSNAQVLNTVAINLTEAAATYGAGTLGLKTYSNAINTFSTPSQSATLGTLVTQASAFGHFHIPAGQALVITLQAGGAGYFVVPVSQAWTITVDPVNHQSSLNNLQAAPNADGTYTFVVANQDPGVQNWIDAAGNIDNTLMIRWQDLPASAVNGGPAITQTQLVSLSALSSALPLRTPAFSAAQRAAQLAARAAGYARRLATQ